LDKKPDADLNEIYRQIGEQVMNNIASMNAFFSQQEADPLKELTPPDVTFDTQSIRSAATRLRTNSGAGQAMSESG